ncbi:hypothetical protein [Hansschlegelia sp.]|uniref:hypothetical protein n=1 Tax=Hansschlegelia sp. TaxID=2041892 RepID=UPI002BFC3E01|nr:hypothetical protein [Hansschlegelia sp.]HVI28094.1 hypothetical protein [Hansschlegelia sp.]
MSQTPSKWSSPIIVTLISVSLSAGLGLGSNAWVSWINASAQADLERSKAEATRILEVIKTGDPDKAAANLRFLIDTGLIPSSEKLSQYMKSRKEGEGASLPVSTSSPPKIEYKFIERVKNSECIFENNTDINQVFVAYTNLLKSKGFVVVPGKYKELNESIAVRGGEIKKDSIRYWPTDAKEGPRLNIFYSRENGIKDEDVHLIDEVSAFLGVKFKCAGSFGPGARFDTTINDVVE